MHLSRYREGGGKEKRDQVKPHTLMQDGVLYFNHAGRILDIHIILYVC